MDIKDLAGFSDPAKTLIEKCSAGLGALFQPAQIVRVAKAEAEAELIKAKSSVEVGKLQALGNVEITEIEERGLARLIREEGKKQEIIEAVIMQALPEVKEDAQPQNIDDDWLNNFFDKCRLISDEEMQVLLGKILAGEANSPGSYSKRTINILQSLGKEEALWFSSICRACFDFGGMKVPYVINVNATIYDNVGITHARVKELESLGLLIFGDTRVLYYKFENGICQARYDGFIFDFSDQHDTPDGLNVGQVLFTKPGSELARSFDAPPIPELVELLVKDGIASGIITRYTKID